MAFQRFVFNPLANPHRDPQQQAKFHVAEEETERSNALKTL